MALSLLRGRLLAARGLLPAPGVTHATPHRHSGYVVLIPEIGEEITEKNILLREDGLPEFSQLTIEKCIAAIGTQSWEFESGVRQIEANADKCKDVFTQILEPLEKMESPMELTWGVAKTLYLGNSTVMPTKSYLQIHQRAHKARLTKFNSIPIYQAVLNEKARHKTLDEEKQRLLDKYELEGKLNGLDVTETEKAKLNAVLTDLQKERKLFKEKVDYATKSFSDTINKVEIVREFPESLLKAMAADSSDAGRGPWKVTLQPYIYDVFMQHCPDRTIRWNTWQAYTRRCSGYEKKELGTSVHLEKIRGLRQQQAKILGFDTFVDMSMETKMAGSIDNVKSVLNNLLDKARPIQDLELESLQKFANERGFDGKLDHYDVPYWQRKQRRTLYNFDDEKIREYFPLPRVLNSLFNLCATLFKINIVERSNVHTWHKDVKFFDVFDSSSNRPVAGFYLDPYAREDDKIRVHDDAGWHISIMNKCSSAQTIPLSALIFNFQVPMYGKQSLLSYQEVGVLFQRFGHSLRHLLTKANYSEVAGLSNVEWDAAEVCGHVMTHWLYDPHTIQALSGHYSTDEPLPDEIIQNLQNVRGHMAGYTLCKELYLATLDIELHSTKEFWRDIVRRMWPQYNALPFDTNDAHPCSFTKIISEEWGAAYYCRIWSRMIAADIYSAFDEAKQGDKGILPVGERYLNTFLALGGSCHPSEVFRRFRGRDPSPNALLDYLRLTKKPEE